MLSKAVAFCRYLRIHLTIICAIGGVLLLCSRVAEAGATTSSSALPDGRGYEKVSPKNNADGNVFEDRPAEVDIAAEAGFTEQPFLVSPDGSAVAYMGASSETGGTGQEGANAGNQYVARRLGPNRWSTTNVEPPSEENLDFPIYEGFSPDLSVGFLDSNGAIPLAEGAPGEKFSTLYSKTFADGSYRPLVTTRPPNRTPEEFGAAQNRTIAGNPNVAYAGSSADLGHELFMANDALTANAVDGGAGENNLYDAGGGRTTLVNVLPDGSTEANATFGGPRLSYDYAANGPILAHDISEDGRRIFWTDLNTGNLYVRENDTAPQSPIVGGVCTVPSDACTVLLAREAQFWDATPDGSKVLYGAGGDLYEHDLADGQTVDIAPQGRVNGVAAASEDLSYVYFVADAALAPGAEQQNCIGEEGSSTPCNLYAVHVGDPIRFIGLLVGADNAANPESFFAHDGDWQGSLSNSEAEATPDGEHLLFTSKSHLTGYKSGFTGQIFMYDFPTGQLTCLSCKPSGEAIKVESTWSAFLPVSHVTTALPRWVSDSGNQAFFDTLTSLVPQDTNEATDVYEWERDGSGGCARSPGCIYMLSDGTSREGSFLIGASASGDDVFITTRGKLVPEDENENIDVYDVRVGAVGPPVAPQCTGSGCQGVPSAPPIFATPPSVTYNGVGNFEGASAATPGQRSKHEGATRAHRLSKELKSCNARRRETRASCRARAERRYGPASRRKRPVSRRRSNVKRSSGRGK